MLDPSTFDPAVALTLRLTSDLASIPNLETGLKLEPTHISAIITAGAAILGVVLGQLIGAIKESWVARKKDAQESAYLAILVVSHLDRFANGCMHVAHDDGTDQGQPAGDGGEFHETTVDAPEFLPLDIEVNWKVLPKKLMFEIFAIPGKRENIENRLAGIMEHDYDWPYFTEYFWSRQQNYAELGLYVSEVAMKLRSHAELPVEQSSSDEWNREIAMREVIERIDVKRADKNKRDAETQFALPI